MRRQCWEIFTLNQNKKGLSNYKVGIRNKKKIQTKNIPQKIEKKSNTLQKYGNQQQRKNGKLKR